jgi:hypothetical protein
MQVTVEYNDSASLTTEEIVKRAQQNYGKHVAVKVMPDSFKPHDLIYHGLSQMITHEQMGIFYDSDSYQTDLATLRAEVLSKVAELIDQVIIDNEGKVAQ